MNERVKVNNELLFSMDFQTLHEYIIKLCMRIFSWCLKFHIYSEVQIRNDTKLIHKVFMEVCY